MRSAYFGESDNRALGESGNEQDDWDSYQGQATRLTTV